MAAFDVVGVGLNATDTLVLLPRFPAYAGKERFYEETLSPGGQVSTAMVACARLGLRAKYIGTIGGDERGRIQLESLRAAGVDVEHVIVREGCQTQSAYILVDQSTGERTVLWRRPDCLRLSEEDIAPEMILSARLLHIDGHDTPAVARASEFARSAGIPVTVDVDTVYEGFERVLASADYLIASAEFPREWTGEADPFRALELIQEEYGMRLAGMTLGAYGALARAEGRYFYSPAFVVETADTTGAGDAFHGAFCYAVLKKMPVRDALEFSNAIAALNCTAQGARGFLATAAEAEALMARAERRSHAAFETRAASA
ncbi:MAG: carbohydrate kinase family protein [bacterium]|jgi:sulfofructose kinase